MWLKGLKKGPSPPNQINRLILQHPIIPNQAKLAKLRERIRIDVDRGSWTHSDRLTIFFKFGFLSFLASLYQIQPCVSSYGIPRAGGRWRVLWPRLAKAVDSSSLQWLAAVCRLGLIKHVPENKGQSYHRLFPADAGLGGPARPECAPVTPARFTARKSRRSG